eukprot:1343464-Pleurochrysis_carterae.AAC.2
MNCETGAAERSQAGRAATRFSARAPADCYAARLGCAATRRPTASRRQSPPTSPVLCEIRGESLNPSALQRRSTIYEPVHGKEITAATSSYAARLVSWCVISWIHCFFNIVQSTQLPSMQQHTITHTAVKDDSSTTNLLTTRTGLSSIALVQYRGVLVVSAIAVTHVGATQMAAWSLRMKSDLAPLFLVWLRCAVVWACSESTVTSMVHH